jgi:transcriptional regulator with XRE-family HTH domain
MKLLLKKANNHVIIKFMKNTEISPTIPPALTLGGKIKTLRKEKGLKQTELADALGVPVSTYSKWETDKFKPRPAQLQAIADALDADILVFHDIIGKQYGLRSLWRSLTATPVPKDFGFTVLLDDEGDEEKIALELYKIQAAHLNIAVLKHPDRKNADLEKHAASAKKLNALIAVLTAEGVDKVIAYAEDMARVFGDFE